MPEPTEETTAKHRAAVAAMKGAKTAMDAVLERNAALERALASARDALIDAKRYIARDVYLYRSGGNEQQSVHQLIDAHVAQLQKVLG
ncbi:MAG TPA: hypothetical protein VIJ94_00940 [Caulobacteraceae bacterium]